MAIKAYMFFIMLVTAAIIIKENKILIAKRKNMKWEFPGGRVEEGEKIEECLKREIKEELDIEIEILSHFMKVCHEYDFGKIELHVFLARYKHGKEKAREHEEIRWMKIDEIDAYEFMEADKKIVEEMKKRPHKIQI